MGLFSSGTVIFQEDTPYGPVEVYDRGDQRELRFGNHIVQSALARKAPELLVLDYTRAMMAAFLFAPADARVLHLGLGAGSLPRFIHHHFPRAHQTVVEQNPVVIDVAYRYFGLPRSPRLAVVEGDGADYLRRNREPLELVILDAFHAEGADPGVQHADVLRCAREQVGAAGWVVNNVWGSDRANLRRVSRTMAATFRLLYAISVRVDSNVILFASSARVPPAAHALSARAEELAGEVPLDFPGLYMRLRRLGVGDAAAAPRVLFR